MDYNIWLTSLDALHHMANISQYITTYGWHYLMLYIIWPTVTIGCIWLVECLIWLTWLTSYPTSCLTWPQHCVEVWLKAAVTVRLLLQVRIQWTIRLGKGIIILRLSSIGDAYAHHGCCTSRCMQVHLRGYLECDWNSSRSSVLLDNDKWYWVRVQLILYVRSWLTWLTSWVTSWLSQCDGWHDTMFDMKLWLTSWLTSWLISLST